jgi:hypothetical protein
MSDPEIHDAAEPAAPTALPENEAGPPRAAAPPPPPPPRRGRGGRVLAALLFVILFAAVGWLAMQQQQLAAHQEAAEKASPTPAPAVSPEQLAALSQRVDALQGQLDQMRQAAQQTPSQDAAAPPAAAPPSPPVDLAPLEARIAALEQRPSAPAPAPAPPAPDLGPIEQKLDNVAAEAQQAAAAQAALGSKLADLQQQLAAAEAKSGQLAGKANSAERLAQTRVALDDGLPLGAIPDAPPALAKFATVPPPTQAALRLSFPQAAAAAVHASEPGSSGKSLGERMWLRAESLVTVKQGDRVLVGSPTAEVLGAAQARLDAGDLAGTLKELDRLDAPAAQAMAQWRGQAQALLDARAALDQMARS